MKTKEKPLRSRPVRAKSAGKPAKRKWISTATHRANKFVYDFALSGRER